MRRNGRSENRSIVSFADLIVLGVVATALYGLFSIGENWRAEFRPVTEIKLSASALPYYTLLSAIRGIVAYFLSLAFTLVVGYTAARWKPAEKFMLPLMDILQSVPVLAFLPGLVLGLIALFPHTNAGLELATTLMIFLGQFSNMLFSFYGSLKSIPSDFNDAATVMGLDWKERLLKIELPFAAVDLAWNSLYSMAGGWFFLSVCEAFTMKDMEFRLPGIGSYMAVAIAEGNIRAMILGICAMITLIVVMDFFIWRPILSWVQRFRLDEVPGAEQSEPMMQIMIQHSRIVRWLKVQFRELQHRRKLARRKSVAAVSPFGDSEVVFVLGAAGKIRLRGAFIRWMLKRLDTFRRNRPRLVRALRVAALLVLCLGLLQGAWNLVMLLAQVHLSMWVLLVRNTVWTLLRVFFAIALATVWALPAGIWIGTSSARIRIFQPIVQIVASFPAPMIFPLALMLFFFLRIPFDLGSMLLLMISIQFYVLINVLAGALKIPRELQYATQLMGASRLERWRTLYFPSVFPSLVTGWITAAGGAWNASIVAEFVTFRGQNFETAGLGATIVTATANQDFPLLAASVTVMIVVVVLLNRTLWARIYDLSQTRFRMEM